ncbi:MAG: ATP-binding protein [Lachnospiraceae bacterium]|nr:ATP-binding protein [Lachnospiraceae bacterium]
MNCIKISVPMNPCSCGYYPDLNRCRCTPAQVRRYMGRISGPLWDRLDLCVETREPTYGEIAGEETGCSSNELREKVKRVQEIQRIRYAKEEVRFNSQLGSADVERYCLLTEEARRCIERIYTKRRLSPRSYHRILKVSRTIADLEESEVIQAAHIQEAFGYRVLDQDY